MNTKAFASQADLEEKKVTFAQLSEHAWAYTAEGDPNTGVIVGDASVLVLDTQATPAMAQDVIRRIREVTDKPIEHVLLTHYHAVRVLGASAYQPQQILASQDTYDLIVERGEQGRDRLVAGVSVTREGRQGCRRGPELEHVLDGASIVDEFVEIEPRRAAAGVDHPDIGCLLRGAGEPG
jgi:glyoxylase-like metal-dependent hydrolase (beta-lactamase superfamily II)